MKQCTKHNLQKRLKRELQHRQWLLKNLKRSHQLKVNQSQILTLKEVIATQQQHSSAED
jgi:hypothetical protein